MALWGNKDDKTSTGTIQVFANGLVTGTGTKFDTELEVGDILRANANDHVVISFTTNTHVNVIAGKPGDSVAAISAGTNYTLSEKPVFPSQAESGSTSGVHGDLEKVFGVDTGEMGETDTNGHAGWVRRITKTDQHGNNRVIYETLVASSSISGDAADDSEFSDP